MVLTLLEGGSRAELLSGCFCLCHKAAWVSSAGGSAPSLFIQWLYSPSGRWIAMEGMFFDWWSQLFQSQPKKEKHLRLLPLSFVGKSLYVFPKAAPVWQQAAACARERPIKIQCCFKPPIYAQNSLLKRRRRKEKKKPNQKNQTPTAIKSSF